MPVRINGLNTGSVTLSASANGGDVTLNLPNANGTVATTSYADTAPGLQYITGQTFTAVSAVNINNCFTSTYDNYRLVVSNLSGSGVVTLRFRVGGVDDSSANYVQRNTAVSDVGFGADRTSSGTSLSSFIGLGTNANGWWLDINDVARTVNTRFLSSAVGAYSAASTGSSVGGGAHLVATAYDGFTLSATSMSGTVRVYGYRSS